jgi:hypothetical protein
MKSIFELCIANYRVEQTGSDDPLFPVLGRLIRSSIKRLARAYRERVPVAMLTSHSQFAASYVVDRFLSSLDAQTTIIRIERSFDDPASFLKHIVHSVGSEAGAASLPQLEHAFELFLRCEKMNRRRTILVLRDIDTQGRQVLAQVRFLIELEIANHFGLMVVVTGPANDSSKVRARFERGAQNGGGVKNAGPRFEVYGIRLIHELGSGVPETVDLLCRKAIEIAAGNDKATVSTTEVKAAARLLGLMQNTRHKQTPDLAPEQAVPGNGSGQLIVRMRGVPEKTIPLNGSNLLIGRDRLCEICVDDAQVSRLHGLIARSTGGVHYRDLGSTNGSAVNGHAAERRILANNDVIPIGDVRLIYSSKGAAEADYIDLDATNTLKILDLSAFPPLDDGGNGTRKPGKS